MGDRLCVGASSDEFNATKGKKGIIPYESRAAIVSALSVVDEVFPENAWDQKASDIKSFNADVFVMGADWEGKFDHLRENCEVVYLPRTADVSTTDIKTALSALRGEKIAELRRAIDALQEISEQLGA